jgi:hypothetical protein
MSFPSTTESPQMPSEAAITLEGDD